jgi:hypothetical protein
MTDQMDDRQFVEWMRNAWNTRSEQDRKRLCLLATGDSTWYRGDSMLCDMATLRLDLKAAQERIAELEKDKERLDWLEEQRRVNGLWVTSSNGCFDVPATHAVISREDDEEYEEWDGVDLRAALDAAKEVG